MTGLSVGSGVAATTVMSTASVLAAVAVGAVTAITILFRGYVLPGTSKLYESLPRARKLARLGLESDKSGPHDERQTHRAVVAPRLQRGLSPEQSEQVLLSTGVIEREDAELRLAGAFREDWLRQIQTLRDDNRRAVDRLASVLGADPTAVELSEHDGRFIVTSNAEMIGWWASPAAFAADIAINSTLASWISEWEELDERTRADLILFLRSLLNACPGCGKKLETPDRATDVVVLDGECLSATCDDCGTDVISSSNE